jgi:hypothetical protein
MFDVHGSVFDEGSGDVIDRRVAEYIDGLMEEFADSPEAKPFIERYGPVNWAGMVMDYGFRYLGVSVPEMSASHFREIVFEIFPRKVSTEADSAAEIIAEMKAFWSFVYRQYNLPNARRILDSIPADAERRLNEELSNPANFGMAKSFFMLGQQAGFDMRTQEGCHQFMHVYNASLMAQQGGGLLPSGFDDDARFGEEDDKREVFRGAPRPSLKQLRKEREKRRKAAHAKLAARKRNRK